MKSKKNSFKRKDPVQTKEIERPPNIIPPETPPAEPEKTPRPEKNYPFHTTPEINPVHEPKTYPDKKEQ